MFRKTVLIALAVSCMELGYARVAIGADGAEASPEELRTQIAEEGSALTPYEILLLYRQRSWVWESGAGYFSSPDRRFVAYSQGHSDATVADGRWEILESGAVCIRAEWTVAGSSYPSLDCFDHSKIGDIVYQRRLPDGDWYLFKDEAVEAGEYNKFERGDLASEKVAGFLGSESLTR